MNYKFETDCRGFLVVLHLENTGIRRHGFLYPAPQVDAAELPACVPPQHHVCLLLDLRQVVADGFE